MKGIAPPRRTALGSLMLALAMLAATPSDAWAYVDPGTGSYLFQLAAASLLAGMYTMRRYWHALASALRGRSADAGSTAPAKRPNDME